MLRKKRFSFPIHNHSKSPGEPRQMQLFATCYPFYLIVSHAGSHKNGDVQARAVFLWPLFFKLPKFGHVIFKLLWHHCAHKSTISSVPSNVCWRKPHKSKIAHQKKSGKITDWTCPVDQWKIPQFSTLYTSRHILTNRHATGWCSTPTLLLICSSFNRENCHPSLICSSLSTAKANIQGNSFCPLLGLVILDWSPP